MVLRVARLLARAEIRRFKSSRSNDFSGDTCAVGEKIWPMKIRHSRAQNVRDLLTLISDVSDDDGVLLFVSVELLVCELFGGADASSLVPSGLRLELSL